MATFHDVTAALGKARNEVWMSQPYAMLNGCKVRLLGMTEQKRWEAGQKTDQQKMSDDQTRAGYTLAYQLVDVSGCATDAAVPMHINKMLTVDQAMMCVKAVDACAELPVERLRVVFAPVVDRKSGFQNTQPRVDFDLPDAAPDAKGGR